MRVFARTIAYWLIKNRYRILNKNLILGHGVKIKRGSKFEGFNKLSDNSFFSGNIGFGSYIGESSHVTGRIGRYCSIGPDVHFIVLTHPTNFVSTHPSFYSVKKQSGFTYVSENKFDEKPNLENEEVPIVVGNDVYIGQGATIIGPLRIGNGAVIAAEATVVKDVPPYAIVAGCPARIVKMRFDSKDIDFLEKIEWWNKSQEWIKKHSELFSSIELFRENVEV